MINQISIKTRLGWISAYENKGKIFKMKFGKSKNWDRGKILHNFKKNLLNFINKKQEKINSPHIMMGNKIQKKIWSAMKKVRRGNTISYGKLAKKYKLSPRHVGKICGQNNLLLIVPCHRVIKNNGSLGGFSSKGGLRLKKKLLDLEKK